MCLVRKILIVLGGSAHLDKILTNHPSDFVLPKDAAQDLISTGFIYLAVWREVFEHFKDADMPLFGLTAKAHLLMHFCILSRLGHTAL